MKTNTSQDATFSSFEFLTAICHEIKTPLSAIMGFSEALKEDINNPKLIRDCAEYAQDINDVAHDLNELVHDLLDIGQVISGNFSTNLTKEIDIKDSIKRSIRINYDYALKRNISIQTQISNEVKYIKLDAKRMKQIFTNILSNAIKYSPSHSEIKISARNITANFFNNLKPALEIIIKDNGFGMTEEQIEAAFLKYNTISNPNSNKVESFGFGLSITKQLIERQNGVIEVTSKVNEGTAVKLIFPY